MFRDTPVSLTDDLWKDLVLPHQSPEDMYRWMQVSQAASLFYRHRDTWKKAIEVRFGIPCSVLNEFACIVYHLAEITDINWQLIFRRLHGIALGPSIFDRHYMGEELYIDLRILTNSKYHLSLLACCLDNITVAKKLLRKDFYNLWHRVAIRGDCVNLVLQHFPRSENILYEIDKLHSARADNTVQHIVAHDLPTHPEMRRCVTHLLDHGRSCHVHYLLSHTDLYGIKLDDDTFKSLCFNRKITFAFRYQFLSRLGVTENTLPTIPTRFLLRLTEESKWKSYDDRPHPELDVIKKSIQFLIRHDVRYDRKLNTEAYSSLISAGYFDYFKHLLANDMIDLDEKFNSHQCVNLIQANCFEAFKFLFHEGMVELPLRIEIIFTLIKMNLCSLPELRDDWLIFVSLTPQNSTELLVKLINANLLPPFIFLLDPANGCQFQPSREVMLAAVSNGTKPTFLEYLLTHHAAFCKPDKEVLKIAVQQHSTEQVRLLLQPRFGLKPTEEDFKQAIYGHYYEMLQFFMDESRGFGFTFTPELFEDLHHFCRRFHPNSRILMAEYMLQPQFGLTISQAFFDKMFTWANFHSNDDAPAGKKTVDFLLFLMDTCQLTLSQEKFQQLFRLGYYYVANLPAMRREQFGHLKATPKMLDRITHDYNSSSEEYFDILLQPHLNLEVPASSLETVLKKENRRFVRALAERCEAVPSLEAVAKFAATGDLLLVEFILKKYEIFIDEKILWFIYECSSLQNVYFLLNLAKKANIIGTDKPFCLDKENRYGLEGNIILLDPQYNLQFKPVDLEWAIGNTPALRGLFASDFAIKRCLVALNTRTTDEAKKQFSEAYQHSPIQCMRVATFALLHPKQYQLKDAERGLLVEYINESLTSFDNLSLVEQREISEFVRGAHFALLDGNHHEYQLAVGMKYKELEEKAGMLIQPCHSREGGNPS